MFEACDRPLVRVESHMTFEIEKHVQDAAVVRFPRANVAVGSRALTSLKSAKTAVLPDGLETVGEGWFALSPI